MSINRGMDKWTVVFHKVEFYSEILIYTTWTNLTIIMQSERSQTKTEYIERILVIWSSRKCKLIEWQKGQSFAEGVKRGKKIHKKSMRKPFRVTDMFIIFIVVMGYLLKNSLSCTLYFLIILHEVVPFKHVLFYCRSIIP